MVYDNLVCCLWLRNTQYSVIYGDGPPDHDSSSRCFGYLIMRRYTIVIIALYSQWTFDGFGDWNKHALHNNTTTTRRSFEKIPGLVDAWLCRWRSRVPTAVDVWRHRPQPRQGYHTYQLPPPTTTSPPVTGNKKKNTTCTEMLLHVRRWRLFGFLVFYSFSFTSRPPSVAAVVWRITTTAERRLIFYNNNIVGTLIMIFWWVHIFLSKSSSI